MKKKNIKKNELFLTKENVKELKKEIQILKDEKRPRIIEEVKIARAQGDLSENAEYDAAKEKQASIEGRILEINKILNNHKLIKSNNNNLIKIGDIVKFKILDTNEIITVKIGTNVDINIEKNIISNISILGSSLLNNEKGKIIVINNNNNPYKIEILEIK